MCITRKNNMDLSLPSIFPETSLFPSLAFILGKFFSPAPQCPSFPLTDFQMVGPDGEGPTHWVVNGGCYMFSLLRAHLASLSKSAISVFKNSISLKILNSFLILQH